MMTSIILPINKDEVLLLTMRVFLNKMNKTHNVSNIQKFTRQYKPEINLHHDMSGENALFYPAPSDYFCSY